MRIYQVIHIYKYKLPTPRVILNHAGLMELPYSIISIRFVILSYSALQHLFVFNINKHVVFKRLITMD